MDCKWTPVYDVWSVLTSIRSLLDNPNPDSPANGDAARLYTENRKMYNEKIRKSVMDSLKDEEWEVIL